MHNVVFVFLTQSDVQEVPAKGSESMKSELLPALQDAVIACALKLANKKGYVSCTVQQEEIDIFTQLINVRSLNSSSEPQSIDIEVEAPASHVFHVTGIAASKPSSGAIAALGMASLGAFVGGAAGMMVGPLGLATGVALGSFLGGGVGALYHKNARGGRESSAGNGRDVYTITSKQVFQGNTGFWEDTENGMMYFKIH